MSDQDYIELIRSIFREVSEQPLGDLALDTRIADVGIDSVTFAEIVVRIEDTLGIEVPFAQWLRVRTVQEVLDMIKQIGDQSV